MRYLELSIAMFQRSVASKKEVGDVCNFRVRDYKWGYSELSEYLLVPFETNLLPSQLKKKLDFITDRVGATAPFRYSIDINDLKKYYKELGVSKAKDISWRYQPFLQNARFDYFTGAIGSCVVDKKFIDCGEDKDSYIVVPYGEKIIYDKDEAKKISLDEMPDVILRGDL